MVRRHQPAALLRVEVECPGRVEQSHDGLAGALGAASGDHDRPSRRPYGFDRRGDRVGVRRDLAGWFGLQPFGQYQRRRDFDAEHVGRNLDVDGARLAEVAGRPRHRLVQLAQYLLRHARGSRQADHGTQDVDVRDVLERAHVDLRPRRAAADQQHRHAGYRGVGDGCHGVGDAGSSGDHRHRGRARQLGVGMRHVGRGTLVPDIDDADAEAGGMVPDRLDVAALQPEHPVDASSLQEARNLGGAASLVRVEVIRLGCRWPHWRVACHWCVPFPGLDCLFVQHRRPAGRQRCGCG